MSNTVLIICITCWWSLSDQDCKDPLVWHCLSRFHRRRNPNWQVLQGVAGFPDCHLRHHPSHRRSRLPCRFCLSSKGLQHSPLSWPCKRKNLWRAQKSIERISLWDLHGRSPQEIYENNVGNISYEKHGSSLSGIPLASKSLQACEWLWDEDVE